MSGIMKFWNVLVRKNSIMVIGYGGDMVSISKGIGM